MIRKDLEVHIVSGCGSYAYNSKVPYLFDVDIFMSYCQVGADALK